MVIYRRPPIIEAIVEFVFQSPIPFEIVERATERIKRFYKFDETEEVFETTVDVTARKSSLQHSKQGRKLSSEDRNHFAIVRRNSIVFSVVPPYPGWPAFIDRIKRDMSHLRRDRGIPSAKQVGIRYINRLDVPHRTYPTPQAALFLKFIPSDPMSGARASEAYMIRVEYPTSDHFPFALKVTSATVEPPLVHTTSFLLDLDVISTAIPKGDDELWEMIEKMKVEERGMFESSITDAARELFMK